MEYFTEFITVAEHDENTEIKLYLMSYKDFKNLFNKVVSNKDYTKFFNAFDITKVSEFNGYFEIFINGPDLIVLNENDYLIHIENRKTLNNKKSLFSMNKASLVSRIITSKESNISNKLSKELGIPHSDKETKTLNVTSNEDLKTKVNDIEIFGEDCWKLICKASSKSQGWMKSTKGMETPNGDVVIQVTTQQKNPDGSYSIAEALTTVPNCKIVDIVVDGVITGRKLIYNGQ
jgi:hypothetical protein